MSSISSKTVIVIDKSYYMCRRVQHALNIDSIVRGNADESYVQKSPTIYQSALQSLTEYCRIVWDIFGSERRFLLKTFYKNRTKTISSWNNQGMDYLRDTLRRSAQNSPNTKDIDASQQSPKYSHLKNVIEDSLKDLAAKSQKTGEETGEKRTAGETGRILVFTYATEENLEVQSNQWRKDLTSSIEKINANARTNGLAELDRVEIVIIDIKNEKVINTDLKILADEKLFKLEVTHVEAGGSENGKEWQLTDRVVDLATQHHRLMRTMISGIPMKEEQTSGGGGSVNYEVPFLHPQLGKSTEMVDLRWNTPKIDASQLRACCSAVRISPLEVNSRHSDCLTKYLSNGRRSVLLSCKDKVTHMLACNGGDIYLHKLSTPFTPQEPPSLENAPGGFRHDYRVNDLVSLINKHTLFPSKTGATGAVAANKAALEQFTRVFPLVNSESALYSMSGTQSVDKILQIVPKSNLTETEQFELRAAAQDLMEKEMKKEPIPWSSGSQGGKPPKKDEQYKILWSELKILFEAHIDNSPAHKAITDSIFAARGRPDEQKEVAMEVDLPEIDKEKDANFNTEEVPSKSLFDCFLGMDHKKPKRPRFYGQVMGRDKVQLYPFLGGESDQVDNMRKDGSDKLENKKALDAVNKKLSKNNMPPKIDHGPVDPRSRVQRRDDSVQRRGDVDNVQRRGDVQDIQRRGDQVEGRNFNQDPRQMHRNIREKWK